MEVDLDYPENVHEEHSDYPMAPEKIKMKTEWLSPYSLENANKFDYKTGNINKLAPNLMRKKNYVVHYRNLKYYLSQGLILKKVHKTLEFKQSAWMKPDIDFNTQKRKETTNKADKILFELLNNAVCGKTMENMSKRIKITIIKNEKDFVKFASRPTYIKHNIFGKILVGIHEKKQLLTLRKPIYVRCTILELRKLEMYKFHYDFMKKKCDKCTLLFTGTDGSCYEIDEDFYEIMHQHNEFFDLSNQPKDSKYYCNDNKKVPGKMKDEYGGTHIYKFIELKSKKCSIRDANKKEKSTHKEHKYEEFKDTHFNKNTIRHKMRGIKSKKT